MSPIDETLISAYLDDELDPESRLRVEEATRADPRLDRMLRELSRVRGLVAGLHRPPEAPDVSGAVVDRIVRFEARRRAYPPFVAAASLAAAAILIVSILRGWNAPVAEGPIEVLAGVPGARGQAGPPEGQATGPGVEVDPEPSTVPGPSPAPEGIVEDRTTPEDPDRRRFVGDLAARPGSLQLTVEALPGHPVDAVFAHLDELLRFTVRDDRRYGLIRPEHSGGVGVFAFIADPTEREQLLRRLHGALDDQARIFEPTAEGLPVALLGGAVGLGIELLVAERPGQLRPVGPVGPDGEIRATKHDSDDDMSQPEGPELAPSLPGGLTPAPGAVRTLRPSSRSAPAPVGPPRDEAPLAVFIWVRDGGTGGD